MFRENLLTNIVIRPSSLPSWNDCPRRGAARLFRPYIEAAGFKLRTLVPNVGALIGTANHVAAHITVQSMIDTGEQAKYEDAIDPALEGMAKSIADGVAWDAITDSLNSAERQVRRMSVAFRQHVAPTLKPLKSEERLEADLGGGFILSGQKDLLCAEPRQIRDLKGGRVRRANALQYGAYSLLERSHAPEPIERLIEDFVPRVDLGKPQPLPEQIVYPAPAAERAAIVALTDIRVMFQRFEAKGNSDPESAFPANPMSMLCSAKFCPAWGTDFCRVHVGAK